MRELDELGTIIDVLLEQSAKEGEYYKNIVERVEDIFAESGNIFKNLAIFLVVVSYVCMILGGYQFWLLVT